MVAPFLRWLVTFLSVRLAAVSSPASEATSPATAPHCTRTRPAPVLPPPDRPISRDPACPSANDDPSHSSPLPVCTTKLARPHHQMARDRCLLLNANSARPARYFFLLPRDTTRGPSSPAPPNCASYQSLSPFPLPSHAPALRKFCSNRPCAPQHRLSIHSIPALRR